MREMDYRLEEMKKITQKQLGLEEKMGLFRWIIEIIASNDENTVWFIGGLVVVS